MEISFYIAAIIAVVATLRVVLHANAVRALINFVVSLLAIAVAFYNLGAPFAAALEVIVYAGAIMVLFVFVIMMLNMNSETVTQEQEWLAASTWVGPAILATVLFIVMVITMLNSHGFSIVNGEQLSAKAVGTELFGPYILVVELASFMLLAALIVAGHVGRGEIRNDSDLQERIPRRKQSN